MAASHGGQVTTMTAPPRTAPDVPSSDAAIPTLARQALDGQRALLDQARDIVLVLRPDGTIVDANRAAVDAYGYDRDGLLRLRIHDLRDPATVSAIPEQLRQATIEGIDFETVHRRRDGTPFPVEVSCRSAELGGERLLLSVIRDVTERKRAEAERERLLAERQALLDSAAEGIFGMDAAGNCTFINPAAVALLGFQPEEVLGRNMHALIHHSRPDGSPYPITECPIHTAFVEGRSLHGVEEVLWRKDGTSFPALYSVTTAVEHGAVTGGVVTIVDISERKRREERAARLQALTAALSAALDRRQVAEVIVEQARTTLAANLGAVAVLSDDGRFFETLRAVGYPPDDAARMLRVPAHTPMMFSDVVRDREPLFIETWAERAKRYPFIAQIPVIGGRGAGVALPLIFEDRPIGAIGFGFPTDRSFSAEERDFLRAIADLCTQALERARLHEAEARARAAAESSRRRAVAAQRQLETVLEQLPALVAYVDTQQRYRIVNRTCEEWFGIDRREVEGRHVREVLGEEAYAGLRPLIERALGGERVSFEAEVPYRAGGTRFVHANLVPDIGESGEVRGYVSLVSDLTARKRAEEERDALLARERRRATQLRGLAEASLAINTARSVEETLRLTAEWAQSLIGTHLAVASTTASQNRDQAITAVSLSEKYAAYRDDATTPDGRGIDQLVCETNRPVRMTQAELEAHPLWRGSGPEASKRLPMRGWLVAPLVQRDGGNLGLLQLSDKTDGDEFTEEDEAVVVQLAQLASVAVENARLNEAERGARQAAERAAARTAALQAVTAALAEALTPDEVAAVAVEQGVDALGARAGVVVLLTEGGHTLEVLRADGYPPGVVEPWQRLPIEAPLPIAEAVRTGTPIWLPSREAAFDRYPPLATTRHELSDGALVAIPLAVEGRTIGALGLSFAGPREFSSEDRGLARALAGQCAQALERARLYQAEASARAAAEEAVRARDLFLSSTSHDLRTPLATIKGQAQLLRLRAKRAQPISATRLEEGLATIETNAARMATLIDELMDVGRLQIGQDLELRRAPTDLVALANGCAAEYRARSPRHDVRFEATVPELVAVVDKERIERVLSNLLANAVKYSPEGGEIVVSVGVQGGEGARWAAVAVRDRGIGIPQQDLPRLFEPFFRGANAVARVAGSGVGLAGSRQIVELHGGTIDVESREGEGSTFTIRLPLSTGTGTGPG